MGPAGLVVALQMSCDHINRGLCNPGLWLQYKQKTHELCGAVFLRPAVLV